MNRHDELDFEINKNLLDKFKRNTTQDERDNSDGKSLKSDGLTANKKVDYLNNGNNPKQASCNKEKIIEKENHSKKLLETFQNQMNNVLNKENSSNNTNTGIINQNEKNKQKVLSEKANVNKNPVRSFLNLDERINMRINPEHK